MSNASKVSHNRGAFLVNATRVLILTAITFMLLSSQSFAVLNFQSNLTVQLHSLCLHFVPETIYSPLYGAIVCGAPISDPYLAQLFRETGLIHILIVSGSHLLLLGRWIKPKFLQLPILVMYSMMTGLQPPVLRALVQICLQKISKRYEMRWSSHSVVFLSGLITWALRPEWISSVSFQLSWICALTLCLTKNQSLLFRITAIYFSTALILAQFQWPHPISLFMNASVTPLIGGVLFPLSFVCFVFPILTGLTDYLWKALITFCEISTQQILMFPSFPINNLHVWIFIWFLHIFAHLYGIQSKRQFVSFC